MSPASPTITTVSTLDPIKVYFTVAEQEYLDFHRRYSTPATVDAERKGLRLELILADGTVYPQNGNFYFADRQVDVRTVGIANTASSASRAGASPPPPMPRTAD